MNVRAGVVIVALVAAACAPDPSNAEAGDPGRPGGDATVLVDGSGAFAQPLPSLATEQRRAFSVGNNFFNDNWVTAPASTTGRDGLGPLFNAQSCSSCHLFDGRAQPPADDADPVRGLLLRLSVPGADGEQPDPVYGGQLQDRSINGVAAEGRISITWDEVAGSFDDGVEYTLVRPRYEIHDLAYGPLADDIQISPRIAPAVFGLGLLEEVPAEAIEALTDPTDRDGDGISGRVNQVPDENGNLVLGRFGWKANVASLRQQNAGAFNGDIGITTSLHPDESCTSAQPVCLQAPTGGSPEVDDAKLDRVTFYTRTLAVPARRATNDPSNVAGETLFGELGCSGCHVVSFTTGPSDIPGLADQAIRPYTDLLLHDMGQGLADSRGDGLASGSEWRTAPLWGIGLVDDVNGHTRLLHDGRARNLTEAILWHGGEGEASQRRFRALPADQRRQLLDFLESL